MVVRSMPASRSQKLSVPNTSSSGSPAEKPSSSMRSVAASRYTRKTSRQPGFGGAAGGGSGACAAMARSETRVQGGKRGSGFI